MKMFGVVATETFSQNEGDRGGGGGVIVLGGFDAAPLVPAAMVTGTWEIYPNIVVCFVAGIRLYYITSCGIF